MQLNTERIETKNSTLELIGEGLVRMKIHDGLTSMSYDGILDDTKGMETLLKGEKGKLLVVTDSLLKYEEGCKKVINATVEKFYVKRAFVTKNSATVLFLNMLLLLQTHSVESKLFTSELKALEWLRK